MKTPVSHLQELLQQQAKPLPQYSFTQIPGATPIFECSVTVGGIKATERASSKQEAKHNSAETMLKKLGVHVSIPLNTPSKISPILQHGNAIGKLNELCSKNGLPYPTYTECHTGILQFTIECEFQTLKSYGTAVNKKDAKQNAAVEMLSLYVYINNNNYLIFIIILI